MATLAKAQPDQVSFVQKDRFASEAGNTKAGLLIADRSAELSHPAIARVDNVMVAVVKALNFLSPEPVPESFIHPSAVVAESASLGENVYIGPNAVIDDQVTIGSGSRIEASCYLGSGVSVGDDCRLFANVTLLEGTQVGNRVRIHSGAVLGADGFRYELLEGRLQKIPQVGIVVVEDDVEIGANTTIDRAFLEETRIGARTKIDNLVQIGHNVVIGSDCVLVSQVGIAGSVKLGRGVMMGGKSGIKDHLTIGNGVRIGGHSAVQNNLPDGAEVLGVPAVGVKHFARYLRFYKDFPKHWEKLKALLDEKEFH